MATVNDLQKDFYDEHCRGHSSTTLKPFYEGLVYRFSDEFTLSNAGDIITYKADGTNDWIANHLATFVDVGAVKVEVIVGATETVAFPTTVNSNPANRMLRAPVRTSYVSLTKGGTITGGEVIDIKFGRAGAPGSARSVPIEDNEPRGVPPGPIYLRLTAQAANSHGNLDMFWQEFKD